MELYRYPFRPISFVDNLILVPKYVEMVKTGEQAARAYLENYHLPTDRFADIKEKLTDLFEIWR